MFYLKKKVVHIFSYGAPQLQCECDGTDIWQLHTLHPCLKQMLFSNFVC
jgi:hypothetical protein